MIVVGTTVAAWKCNGKGEMAWLKNAEAMIADARSVGQAVTFFVAVEVDGRGYEPFQPMHERLQEAVAGQMDAGFSTWTFSIDDGAETIDSNNRLIRICTGRNLIHEFAKRIDATHILFLDSDMEVQPDCVSKLLELDHPVVGGDAPQYGLHGPVVLDDRGRPRFPFRVEEHWNTAGFLLVTRDVFRAVSWRWDVYAGMTDDPAFQQDTRRLFGETWVRKDVVGINVEPLIPVESRDEGIRRVHR